MPFRVPLARNTAALLSERHTARLRSVCPSCSLWRLSNTAPRKTSAYPRLARAIHSRSRPTTSIDEFSPTLSDSPTRSASTLVSRSAINAPSNVPDTHRNLYASLERLKDTASDYVNQSRIQLALRGLEVQRPTIRIGLLGLGSDGNSASRKLARVLLADALSNEEQWEKILVNGNGDSGKALLLRSGENPSHNIHLSSMANVHTDMVLKMIFTLLIRLWKPSMCLRESYKSTTWRS